MNIYSTLILCQLDCSIPLFMLTLSDSWTYFELLNLMSGISSYSSLFRVFQLHVGSETLFACKMPSSAHCNLDMVGMTRHVKLSRSLVRILCCCNFASKSRTSVTSRSWLMQNVCDIILANSFYGTQCLWNVHHWWQLIAVFSITESLSLPDN